MHCLPITEASQVASARRLVTQLAQELGFHEAEVEKVALLTTEAATNLVQHATGGRLLVRPFADACGIELLALDTGPGMRNAHACLRDGYSTAGSLGTGLGAICRLATHWDIHSIHGVGTALLAQVVRPTPSFPPPYAPLLSDSSRRESARLDVGAVCLPIAGEKVCGDGWAVVRRAGYSLVNAYYCKPLERTRLLEILRKLVP